MPADRIDVRVHRSAQSEQETRDAGSGAGIAALLCGECMAPLSLLMETGAEAAHPTLVGLRAHATRDLLAWQEIDFDQPAPPPPLSGLLTGTPYLHPDGAPPPYGWCVVDIGSTGGTEAIAPSAATFAQEAFVDELAEEAGSDPVAYRLAHLRDSQGSKLIRSVPRPRAGSQKQAGLTLRARSRAAAALPRRPASNKSTPSPYRLGRHK
jgi:nicotinate dehydrogenase subunit B